LCHAGKTAFWGWRVMELGDGPRPIPQKRLTAEKLAVAIRATTDPIMVARASALGERIRTEDGIAAAVRMLNLRFNFGRG